MTFNGFTQSKRIDIQGNIISDSASVENIHIINKTIRKATTSDFKGRFRIPAKVNDTLQFSAVQFENKTIIINKVHIKNLSIIVSIKSAVNQLSEVILKKTENMAKSLGLPNADKKPLNKLESRLNYHSKASVARVLLGILLREKGSINDMYYITSGKRKKDRKLTKLIENDKFDVYQSKQIQEIRKHYTEFFFTKTLKLPKEEIDFFIKFCDTQGDVIYLFSMNRDIEVIDIFIKESERYLNKWNNH